MLPDWLALPGVISIVLLFAAVLFGPEAVEKEDKEEGR